MKTPKTRNQLQLLSLAALLALALTACSTPTPVPPTANPNPSLSPSTSTSPSPNPNPSETPSTPTTYGPQPGDTVSNDESFVVSAELRHNDNGEWLLIDLAPTAPILDLNSDKLINDAAVAFSYPELAQANEHVITYVIHEFLDSPTLDADPSQETNLAQARKNALPYWHPTRHPDITNNDLPLLTSPQPSPTADYLYLGGPRITRLDGQLETVELYTDSNYENYMIFTHTFTVTRPAITPEEAINETQDYTIITQTRWDETTQRWLINDFAATLDKTHSEPNNDLAGTLD